MAEDQSGLRKDYLREFAPWTKLFSAFKVAMDPKKLLLAGGGIFVMAVGWWILAFIHFNLFISKVPQFEDVKASDYESAEEAWKAFKEARRNWNLAYEMAGPAHTKRDDPDNARHKFDAADFAETLTEYHAIVA